jgi:hypothetical protein
MKKNREQSTDTLSSAPFRASAAESRNPLTPIEKGSLHSSSDALVVGRDGSRIVYEDITMPKNTAVGIYISAFAFLFGFAAIWHIIWLAVASVIGVIVCIVMRSTDEETEYVITAEEVEKIEQNYSN